MTVTVRSTGQKIEDPDDNQYVSAGDLRRLRQGKQSEHARQLEAIARRREEEARAKSPDEAFIKAADAAAYSNPEIDRHPGLKQRFFEETQRAVNHAATTGEVVDWHQKFGEIASRVREAGGLPTVESRDRESEIAEMKRARGQ